MVGRVVSTKLKNTATVLVERVAMHPLYKKTYVQSKKYLVDDKLGVKIGDIVDFINCKPVSKNKRWKTTKVLGRNFAEIAEAHLKEKAQEAIAEVMPEEKISQQAEGTGSITVDSGQPEEIKKKSKSKKEKK